MSFSNLFSKIAVGAVAGLMLSATAANALIYNITDVINETSGGFTSTVFHSATSNGGAGGSIVETAVNGPATGTYNDVTGALTYSFSLQSGKTVSGVGNIDFSVGPDVSLGTITTTFSSAVLGSTEFVIEYFQHTYAGAANSFDNVFPGIFLTLWGADGTPTSNGLFDTQTTTIGSDLRFALIEDPTQNTPVVPLPAALPLYGTGLAIMGFVAWRRKRKAAA